MCKSRAEGGQRCASHTRDRYAKITPDHPTWETVAAEYASTSEGEDALKREATTKMNTGDYEAAARLNTAIARGITLRQANKEAAARIRATRETEAAPTGWDAQVQHATDTSGIGPDDVCPDCNRYGDDPDHVNHCPTTAAPAPAAETPGTYQGKTAEEWRAQAAASRQSSADSFERSDTDGYLSQWASDTMARKYDACATLAEADGHWEFPALLDTNGTLVHARLIDTKFGQAFMLLDDNDRSTGQFVNLSKARTAERRNAHYASKGYQVGRVRVPATVRLSDGMMPSPYYARTDGGYTPDAEIVATHETIDY